MLNECSSLLSDLLTKKLFKNFGNMAVVNTGKTFDL